MRIKYYPERLAKSEQHVLDGVLAEALEVQSWFAVAHSWILRDEVRIILQ
jgi:hypothetical protein